MSLRFEHDSHLSTTGRDLPVTFHFNLAYFRSWTKKIPFNFSVKDQWSNESTIKNGDHKYSCPLLLRPCEEDYSPTDHFTYIGQIAFVLAAASLLASTVLFYMGNYANMYKWTNVCGLSPIVHLSILFEPGGDEKVKGIREGNVKADKKILFTKDRIFGKTPTEEHSFQNQSAPSVEQRTSRVFKRQPLNNRASRGQYFGALLITLSGANWSAVDRCNLLSAEEELVKHAEGHFDRAEKDKCFRMLVNLRRFDLLKVAASHRCVNTLNLVADELTRSLKPEELTHMFSLQFDLLTEHSECLTVLAKYKAFARAKNQDDVTALHLAANSGNLDCLIKLIRRDAKINAVNTKGETPLHLAAKNGHGHCLKKLLDNKAEICQRIDGNTPLHLAVHGNHLQCLEHLMDIGSRDKNNIGLKNKNGETPINLARKNEFAECSGLLERPC